MTPANIDLLRAWPEVWRFADLWLAVTHGEPVDAAIVTRRVAERLLQPPTADQALDALLAEGEIDAAELQMTEDALLGTLPMPEDRDRLERRIAEARGALSARFAERVDALERRAGRAGIDLDLSAARAWTPGRWKAAEEILARLAERCRAEEERTASARTESTEPASGVHPRPTPIIWPVPESGVSLALDWFTTRKPAPPAVHPLLPSPDDRAAVRLVSALDALLSKKSDWRQPEVEELVRAFAALVGAHASGIRALGGGYIARLRGLDAPGLPGLSGSEEGLPIWLAPRVEVQLPVDLRGRLHIAFTPQREQARRPPALRLDALMLLGVVADRTGRRDRLLGAFARDLPIELAIPPGWPSAPRPRPVATDEHRRLVRATLGWLDLEPEAIEVIDRLSWMAGGDDSLLGALLADVIRRVPTRAGSPRGAVTLDEVERAWRGEAVREAATKLLDGLSGAELATLDVLDILEISLPGRALSREMVIAEAADYARVVVEEAREALVNLERQGLVLASDGKVWLPAAGLSAPSLRAGVRRGT